MRHPAFVAETQWARAAWVKFTISVLAALLFLSSAAVLAQSDQDTLFNQAVQAYQQNQFRTALAKFQQVSGARSAEAQEYIGKIKTYMDAWSAAMTVLQRSPDERDARSLAYAIEELQVAINIKADGPGEPGQRLAQARQLKLEVEQAQARNPANGDAGLCERALAAAAQHRYKEAGELSCMLANDNAGYSCGGNEAVYVCQLDTALAKMPADNSAAAPNQPPAEPSSTALNKAKAAYDSNDFERARSLFQKLSAESNPAAAQYLDKISRYNDSLSNAEKLSVQGKYEEARTAFVNAASIKPDGPGHPQSRAATMELMLGLDQFYSGDYVSATQHLETCANANIGKQGLIHFYLGASKLARFFVTGGEDSALQTDALNDLKLAKQEGFKAPGQDLSPRILNAYKGL